MAAGEVVMARYTVQVASRGSPNNPSYRGPVPVDDASSREEAVARAVAYMRREWGHTKTAILYVVEEPAITREPAS